MTVLGTTSPATEVSVTLIVPYVDVANEKNFDPLTGNVPANTSVTVGLATVGVVVVGDVGDVSGVTSAAGHEQYADDDERSSHSWSVPRNMFDS